MKLRLNLRDLDLVDRFCMSRVIVFNIVNIIISVMYEIFYKGIMVRMCMFSKFMYKVFMFKLFEDFGLVKIFIDCI